MDGNGCCNVKEELKKLASSINNDSGIPFDLQKFGHRVASKQKVRRTERKAWTTLLTFLNSPYLVSRQNFHELVDYDNDNEFKIYNDLMVKAFTFKVCRKTADGLKIEQLVDKLKAMQVNPMQLRFLLSLSNIEGGLSSQEDVHNIYDYYSTDSGLQDDLSKDQSFSNWVDFGKKKFNEKEKMFFQVDMLQENTNAAKNIFLDTPARQFMEYTHGFHQQIKDESADRHSMLFGALTNRNSTTQENSLEMVLSLPEMSQDSSSLIFKPKSKSVSIDEGFIDDTSSTSSGDVIEPRYDPNDHLQIWTDCLHTTHRLAYTWERLTRRHEGEPVTYLTECGPSGMDHLLNLRQIETSYITEERDGFYFAPIDELIKHSINVLIGLPSKTFQFNKARCCFTVDPMLRMSGLSPESVQGILLKFAGTGTHYRQLNKFTQHHSEKLSGLSGGLTLEAFVTSLRKYIDSYKHAVLLIQDNVPETFLKLWAMIQDIAFQMRFLADVCLCSAAFRRDPNAPKPKFPMGLKLISYLYDLCIKNKSTIHYAVLLNFYKDTSLPLLRYITNWIFDGMCRDPYSEFLLDVDDQYLCYRDKHYWTHGYVLKANRRDIGMFDTDFIDQIYACGKAINLLKLTNGRHYLQQTDLQRPSIKILLSTVDLEKVNEQSEAYVARVHQAKAEERRSRQVMMDEILQKRKKEMEKGKLELEKNIKRIKDMEEQIRQTTQVKKFNELQRLKKQMEDDFEMRKIARETRLKEEKEYLKGLEAMESEKDERTRKEREKLLAYYDELTKRAVARENRALWNVRRLELHQKRKEFIKNEEMTLQREFALIEKNENAKVEPEEKPPDLREVLSQKQRDEDYVLSRLTNDDAENEQSLGAKVQESSSHKVTGVTVEKSTEQGIEEISSMENKTVSDSLNAQNQISLPVVRKPSEALSSESQYGKEGSETKNLIYGDGEMEFDVNETKKEHRKLWEIEKAVAFQPATEMKELLYPGPSDEHEVLPFKSSRGHEPVSKIKKLIYNEDQGNTENEDNNVVASFSEEEIFREFEVEPLQIEFNSMNLPPQPAISDSVIKDVTPRETNENLADAIDHLSLEMIIDRSIIAPVYAQIKLVQNAAVEYFMDTLGIGLHFDAFRKFLLLEDGEFGHSLCNEIFEKVFTCISPKEFCRPAILNNMINKAMQFSIFADKVVVSRQLTFSLKWIPDAIRTTDIAALDFLQLRYKVPWPCNIVVTENCVIKYNKVFSFLLRLKMVSWALQRVWKNLKKAGHGSKAAASSQLRQLQLFRHEMQHFVNNVERYLVNQIIHISWQEFQDDLKNNVHNVDDLHKSHVNYLNRIIFRSLLSKNAAPVLKIISDIFCLILKFDYQLLSSQWRENQDGYVTHSSFSLMCATHKAFKEYTAFLFKVVSKLIRRGYQHHLDDFLLQVNFNGYYEHAVS